MSEPRRPTWSDLDWLLLGSCVALALIGIAFIDSAKGGAGLLSREAVRQCVFLVAALVVTGISLLVDYRTLVRHSAWLYAGGLVLLLVVAAVGRPVGGAKSWLVLRLPGLSLSLQPSEFMKIGTVLLLASLAVRRPPGGLRVRDVALLGGVVALPVALILREPDLGTALTFFPLLAATMFIAGLPWRLIAAAALSLALVAPLGWSVLKPYQQERLLTVVQPDRDPSGVGYHAIQSRIAVGSGGLAGQGYRQGPQNRLGFLPERHTDFIFAIVAEEWGFVGAVTVLGLYLLVIKRLVTAAVGARDRLGAFLCVGSATFVVVHLVVNVGMVLGLMPTIGIPLPLLSYGGSSLMATFLLVGLAANVGLRRFAR